MIINIGDKDRDGAKLNFLKCHIDNLTVSETDISKFKCQNIFIMILEIYEINFSWNSYERKDFLKVDRLSALCPLYVQKQ